MTAWTFEGEIASLGGPHDTVTLVEETTFCLSDRTGDVRPGAPHGLLFLETRFVSVLALRIDGRRLEPLGFSSPDPFCCTFLARVPGAGGVDEHVLVTRERRIGRGMVESVEVRNFSSGTAAFDVELMVMTDFADLFEVKEQRPTASRVTAVVADGPVLRIEGTRAGVPHRMVARSTPDAIVTLGEAGPTLRWPVELDQGSAFTACIEIEGGVDDQLVEPRHRCDQAAASSGPARRLGSWRASVPVIAGTDDRLVSAFGQGVEDIGGLQLSDPDHPDDTVVAAGAPWFMTLFGRDALITSYMALPVDPSIALGSLRTLARLQGTVEDERTEEQPGRILHEIRFTRRPSWRFDDGDRYYGTVDATPLFVVVLGELRRWGLSAAEVDDLLPAADAALAWIDRYGDRDGDGFVEYERSTPLGLANQGWKDSWDAIRFADGRMAEPPIALAEVQGYVYAALVARAHFAEEAGDQRLCERLRSRAAELKRAFNEQFFLERTGSFAMALDGHKQPVDAVASNMGHCLWSGIVDEELAPSVADALLAPEMFTGWGVRTLSTTAAAYNPISYHNGSVWPHDNALIVAGLVRYGFVDHARRIIDGLLDVSTHFGGRLPELIAGIDRAALGVPAIYPTSCMPQAWAAATPLLLVRSLLRLDPWAPHDQLWTAPILGAEEQLALERVPFAGATVDIRARGSSVDVDRLDERFTLHPFPRAAVPDRAARNAGG
ncbi:amylo-alpha-1,6-glucosidase [Dermatobacter hominis]|uniref:amylo-alpha-1,6-glucosidase n=1 Tax=Dermatobacter hominis TaxID=2884263 RepID=UPI001D10F113|nr:glycogen debranching N-terminal domain-containing protein [Dermatobacter hominis]UDY34292.1 hypothetical protein LH044_13190 [Dermatobacter hominis]